MERKSAFMLQPPYVLELAPCDFWLFSSLKMGLRGQCLQPLKTLNAVQQLPCTPYQRKLPMSASKHGKTVWGRERECVSAWARKGCASRVIMLGNTGLQIHKLYGWIPRTFWFCVRFWGFYGEMGLELQSCLSSPLGTGPGVHGQPWVPTTPQPSLL